MEPPRKRQRREGDDASLLELFDIKSRNNRRLKNTFESIFEKYGKDFTGVGDEIDLETGEIVVDNGHIGGMMLHHSDNEDERDDERDYHDDEGDDDGNDDYGKKKEHRESNRETHNHSGRNIESERAAVKRQHRSAPKSAYKFTASEKRLFVILNAQGIRRTDMIHYFPGRQMPALYNWASHTSIRNPLFMQALSIWGKNKVRHNLGLNMSSNDDANDVDDEEALEGKSSKAAVKKTRPWTEAEDERAVRMHTAKISCKEMALYFEMRTAQQIYYRVEKIKKDRPDFVSRVTRELSAPSGVDGAIRENRLAEVLAKDLDERHNLFRERVWNLEDDDFLVDLKGRGMSFSTLSALLHRSKVSVRQRYRFLKSKRASDVDEEKMQNAGREASTTGTGDLAAQGNITAADSSTRTKRSREKQRKAGANTRRVVPSAHVSNATSQSNTTPVAMEEDSVERENYTKKRPDNNRRKSEPAPQTGSSRRPRRRPRKSEPALESDTDSLVEQQSPTEEIDVGERDNRARGRPRKSASLATARIGTLYAEYPEVVSRFTAGSQHGGSRRAQAWHISPQNMEETKAPDLQATEASSSEDSDFNNSDYSLENTTVHESDSEQSSPNLPDIMVQNSDETPHQNEGVPNQMIQETDHETSLSVIPSSLELGIRHGWTKQVDSPSSSPRRKFIGEVLPARRFDRSLSTKELKRQAEEIDTMPSEGAASSPLNEVTFGAYNIEPEEDHTSTLNLSAKDASHQKNGEMVTPQSIQSTQSPKVTPRRRKSRSARFTRRKNYRSSLRNALDPSATAEPEDKFSEEQRDQDPAVKDTPQISTLTPNGANPPASLDDADLYGSPSYLVPTAFKTNGRPKHRLISSSLDSSQVQQLFSGASTPQSDSDDELILSSQD